MLLTVFTSTYNRAGLLPRIFESIVRQGRTDIEWLVVDDGSDDNTQAVVAHLARKAHFQVRYHRQPRGGKHRAYNMALPIARGELFLTLDSDDWLPDGAVGVLENYMPVLRGNKRLCGLIGLKADAQGQICGREIDGTSFEAGNRKMFEQITGSGERCIVLKTEVANSYPFPTVDGELFMTENVVFSRLATDYGFALANKILSFCEYQPDGLTRTIHSLLCGNPVGFMLYHSQRIGSAINFKTAFGSALRYVAFRSIAGAEPGAVKYAGKYNWLVSLLSPLGPIGRQYYLLRNKQFRRMTGIGKEGAHPK